MKFEIKRFLLVSVKFSLKVVYRLVKIYEILKSSKSNQYETKEIELEIKLYGVDNNTYCTYKSIIKIVI